MYQSVCLPATEYRASPRLPLMREPMGFLQPVTQFVFWGKLQNRRFTRTGGFSVFCYSVPPSSISAVLSPLAARLSTVSRTDCI